MAEERGNMYLNGIMGVVAGDALGVPVEFSYREELDKNPVVDMRGYGTYNLPAGSWSDDSSMTLAALDSLRNGYDLEDMADKFAGWMTEGVYTPFGDVFDIGQGTALALRKYMRTKDVKTCGGTTEYDNGNGSLMRIMPVCLFTYNLQKQNGASDEEAILMVHNASALTHNHLRSKIACGLYFFMVRAILDNPGTLRERLQEGLDRGFAYYEKNAADQEELGQYDRLRNLAIFADTHRKDIRSSGYVVHSLEAAVWCLLNTDDYRECVLLAVNLGSDTDTVAAIAGGLAGLQYGYAGIPKEWLDVIKRREWIEDLCNI